MMIALVFAMIGFAFAIAIIDAIRATFVFLAIL